MTRKQKKRLKEIQDFSFQQLHNPPKLSDDMEVFFIQLRNMGPVKRFMKLGAITHTLLSDRIDEFIEEGDQEMTMNTIQKRNLFQRVAQDMIEDYIDDGKTGLLDQWSNSIENEMRQLFDSQAKETTE